MASNAKSASMSWPRDVANEYNLSINCKQHLPSMLCFVFSLVWHRSILLHTHSGLLTQSSYCLSASEQTLNNHGEIQNVNRPTITDGGISINIQKIPSDFSSYLEYVNKHLTNTKRWYQPYILALAFTLKAISKVILKATNSPAPRSGKSVRWYFERQTMSFDFKK